MDAEQGRNLGLDLNRAVSTHAIQDEKSTIDSVAVLAPADSAWRRHSHNVCDPTGL